MKLTQLIRQSTSPSLKSDLEFEPSNLENLRMRTDEVTEASEKLAVPMQNSFDYQIGEDGELWFQGQAIGPILDKSIHQAELVAKVHPQFTTELIRRQIERQEYDDQRSLALGGAESSDTLVVLSPIPDLALDGVELGAYDLDRRVTMMRVYRRTESGINAISLSLDLSDCDGLREIAKFFGQDIESHETSEEILAKRFWIKSSDIGGRDITSILRRKYDDVLSIKYGGEWYAGQQDTSYHDAKEFIESQSDIVSQHMSIMSMIQKEPDADRRKQLAEAARYNFVAALDLRLKGLSDKIGDNGSILSGAGAAAKDQGIEYKSSCPSGEGLDAEQTIRELGFGDKLKYGECRVCLRKVMVGECFVCMICEEADNQGRDLMKIHQRAKQRQQKAASKSKASSFEIPKENKLKNFQRKLAKQAIIERTLVVGGVRETLRDD